MFIFQDRRSPRCLPSWLLLLLVFLLFVLLFAFFCPLTALTAFAPFVHDLQHDILLKSLFLQLFFLLVEFILLHENTNLVLEVMLALDLPI